MPEDPGQTTPHCAFSANTHKSCGRCISLINLEADTPAHTEVNATNDYIELIIRDGIEVHTVYLSLRSKNGRFDRSATIHIGNWSTDAYMLRFTTHVEEASPAPHTTEW